MTHIKPVPAQTPEYTSSTYCPSCDVTKIWFAGELFSLSCDVTKIWFAGELFSDGGDMSDIVELPATDEDMSNDEVPVKELSSDNILTVSIVFTFSLVLITFLL